MRDKVVVVTGGTRGIGRSIAVRLASAGARLALTYRRDAAAAAELADRLAPQGAEIRLFQADIADPAAAAGIPDAVAAAFGRIDVLVNNAGGTMDGGFLTMPPDQYEAVIRANLLGTFRVSLAALPYLRASRGTVVVIGSLAGVTGKEGQVPYATSKGGLIGMTRLLARELGGQGVRVNLVAPGFIRTDMTAALDPKMYGHILHGTALHDMGRPEDVADAVEFLAGPHSSYMTGCTLRVDGGLHV